MVSLWWLTKDNDNLLSELCASVSPPSERLRSKRIIGVKCIPSYNKTIFSMSCMQKSSCTPNIVKNSLKMLIYFHVNSAFSLVFASLWDTI
uniref:Uncharacterized protein n=2 Tax=Candidatus Kentrum sp. FM TaxID=2126340 RepID=A0A450VNE7_9GAMM|nr:MAG: hypothetical protein BECKFM1743C_GA0114222_1001410 [Candidatus Kentron sp. FM]VFJ53511.1 MAG: hypothetical protein BECKFM1743A_GA0114220_1011510 [Candidatus Kentron sp. FM]VFK06332.1 MAG: hypothetical protein BECKFM1743B_GA0114221_100148 [Candidatus Kentron sp. FM]